MSQIVQVEESIKLYEYEFPKPDLDNESLEHFGILGMHWGHRNGPPYPLSSEISTGKRLKKGSGGSGSITRKRRKALKKARKARALSLKKKEEIAKTKEDIIKSKDVHAMLKNVDNFTNQEINDMLTRLDVERRLKEVVAKQNEANKSGARRLKDTIKTSVKEGLMSGTRSTAKTVSENALKMGVKKLAEKIGENSAKNDEESKKYKEMVDKLFREKKK